MPPGQHQAICAQVPSAFVPLLDAAVEHMSSRELTALPSDVAGYVNTAVMFVVTHVDRFEELLKQTIVELYRTSVFGERFILDPRDGTTANTALFLESDGEVVAVRNATLERVDVVGGERELRMTSYSSYEVLTGRLAGSRFKRRERPLPQDL